MLLKTAGIAIRNTRYSDNSLISKIYTRNLGMQTYMIRSIRSPKAPIKPSLLQPLTLLELVVYNKPSKEIQHLKEAIPRPGLHDLHFNVLKSAIGLFVAELLNRSVKEEEANEALFDFTRDFILRLDDASANLSMYPLWFCVNLSRHLGFFPRKNYAHDEQVFDLSEGRFADRAETPQVIEAPHTRELAGLLDAEAPESVRLEKASRVYLLDKMMDYYALHIPGFGSLRSLPVLGSLLRDD
jgi:DNA repair protein RecO (recombination protein O)